MFRKVGISLMAALMMSSVVFACDGSLVDDGDSVCDFSLTDEEYLECCLSLVDNEYLACDLSLLDNDKNMQESNHEERKTITFDKDVVRRILLEDGYQEDDVEIKMNRVENINIKLQPVLNAYLADRTISSDFSVEGLTMKMIMGKYSCNFWNALGFMDSYIDDPVEAKLLIDAPPLPHHGMTNR